MSKPISIILVIAIALLMHAIRINREYARQIIEVCRGSRNRQVCYDTEVPKLARKLPIQDVFRIYKTIQRNDAKASSYCHLMAHRIASEKVKIHPDNWKEVLSDCPQDVCADGCRHGVLQEVSRSGDKAEHLDQFITVLSGSCDPHDSYAPSLYEQGHCYHGLGHTLVIATEGDMYTALRFCDRVGRNPASIHFAHPCYNGAFMQLYSPTEPDDQAIVKGKQPKKDELLTYCQKFRHELYGEEKQSACWRQGIGLFTDAEVENPQWIVDYCRDLKTVKEQRECHTGMFWSIGGTKNFDADTIAAYCNALPTDLQGTCLGEAAFNIVRVDRRLAPRVSAICQKGRNESRISACYEVFIHSAGLLFHPNSSEQASVCKNIPKPWADQCMNTSIFPLPW